MTLQRTKSTKQSEISRKWYVVDAEDLARKILLSQHRRLFLRQALAQGQTADWDFVATDELEQHCLRADKVYSQWAYQGILGYRFPEEK